MSIKIPSAVLARLQILFQSGATLDEATEVLELELAAHDIDTGDKVFEAGQLAHLASLTKSLGDHVSAMLEMQQVRDVPEVAGALDMVNQRTQAIAREIEALPKAAKTADKTPSKPSPAPSPQKKKPAAPTLPPSARSAPPSATKASAPRTPSSAQSKPASEPKTSEPPASSAAQSEPAASAPQAGPEIKAEPGAIPTALPSAPKAFDDAKPILDEDIPLGVIPVGSPSETPPASQPEVGNTSASAPSKPNGGGSSLRDKMAAAVSQIDIMAREHPSHSGSPSP